MSHSWQLEIVSRIHSNDDSWVRSTTTTGERLKFFLVEWKDFDGKKFQGWFFGDNGLVQFKAWEQKSGYKDVSLISRLNTRSIHSKIQSTNIKLVQWIILSVLVGMRTIWRIYDDITWKFGYGHCWSIRQFVFSPNLGHSCASNLWAKARSVLKKREHNLMVMKPLDKAFRELRELAEQEQ